MQVFLGEMNWLRMSWCLMNSLLHKSIKLLKPWNPMQMIKKKKHLHYDVSIVVHSRPWDAWVVIFVVFERHLKGRPSDRDTTLVTSSLTRMKATACEGQCGGAAGLLTSGAWRIPAEKTSPTVVITSDAGAAAQPATRRQQVVMQMPLPANPPTHHHPTSPVCYLHLNGTWL